MSDKLRMNAYYYHFDETGVRVIDEILSAVACAGKAYHHTDMWDDKPDFEGKKPSCVDNIQNAANRAANHFRDVCCE